MLNKNPIITNSFSRGGSNLFWNLLQSHPKVTSPIGETEQVFIRSWGVIDGALLSALSGQPLLFHAGILAPRRALPNYLMRYMDRCLYRAKLRTLQHAENRFKAEGVEYTLDEVRHSRLAFKNIEGIIFLNGVFAQMYPDATFVALIRNGLALLDGYLRRNYTIQRCAEAYVKIMRKIEADSQTFPNYYIMRFEDLTADPVAFLKELYEHVNLDIDALDGRVRLKIKPHIRQDGQWTSDGTLFKKRWLTFDAFEEHLDPTVDQNQISRLTEADVGAFMAIAGETMRHFGYAD